MTVILNSTKYSNIYQSLNKEFYNSHETIESLLAFYDDQKRIFERWISDTHNLKIGFENKFGFPIGIGDCSYLINFDSEEEKTLFLLSWDA